MHVSAPSLAWLVQKLRKPTAVYLLSSAITRAGVLLLIPLYAKRLNPAEYGDYILAQTMLGLAPALALGAPMAIARFFFDERDVRMAQYRFGSVSRWTAFIAVAVGALCQTAIMAAAPSRAVGLMSIHGLTCVNVAVVGQTMYGLPIQHARNLQRPLVASAFQLAEFAGIVGTGLWFVLVAARGLDGALEAMAVTYATLGVVGVAHTLRTTSGRLDIGLLKDMLLLSLPYVPHFIAQWLQAVADRWVLKLVGDPAAVGLYGLAGQLAVPVAMVVLAWNLERSARTGEVFRQAGLLGLRRELPEVRRSYLVAALIPAVAVFAAQPLIKWVIGHPEVFGFVPYLLLINVIDAMYFPEQMVAYYAGKSRAIALVTVVASAVAVACGVILVRVMGPWGALLARGISSTTRTVLMWAITANILRNETPKISGSGPAAPR